MAELGRQFSLFETDIRHLEFRKPSALTQMSNNGNLNQRKSMNAFLLIAKDILKRYPNCELFQVDLGVLKAISGINGNDNKQLKKDLKALTTMGFEYNILKKEEYDWGAFPFLSFIHIKSKRGQTAKVTFSLAPPIKIALTDPNMWVRLCIYLQQNMKSKYGIALWENLSDYAKLQKISYDIDQFKLLMGIQPHQYKVITMLKKKVIDVGLNEVNKETTLRASYEFVKTGTKITGITFFVKNIVKAIDPEHINKQIYDKLKYYGFKAAEIKKLLKERDEDYLMSNIAVVQTYLEKGMDIKNVRAYMKSAFKDDYRQQLSQYEKAQQEKKGLQQAEEEETKKAELALAILKGEFNQAKAIALEKAKSELSKEQLQELKKEFEQKIMQTGFLKEQYLKRGFEYHLNQIQRKNFLIEKLLPSDLHNFENYKLRPLRATQSSS